MNCEHQWEWHCNDPKCMRYYCDHKGRLCIRCGIDKLEYLKQ